MDPRSISISDYDYPLPPDRIAEYPLQERDQSKLLVCQEALQEDIFKNMAHYLPEDSLIIFNNTRVVEARLLFQKPTGAIIEVFCLEPDNRYPDITTAFAQTTTVFWKCLVGNAASWTPGLVLQNKTDEYTLTAHLLEKRNGFFIIQLSWTPEPLSFAEILHAAGAIPLPPYIKRSAEPADAVRYQTIYAETVGSVAAPTAGLHFTPFVLKELSKKNILQDQVTLHVGAGTFKPVKSETVGLHEMHAETFEVKISTIDHLLEFSQHTIIAVGTTSMRTLESIYWLGVRVITNPHTSITELFVSQWEPYDSKTNVSSVEALEALREWMRKNDLEILTAKTAIIIAPPYECRIVKALITNFHQPRSTLLLLVAAFVGDKWRSAYSYALDHDFRFLSYGDSCLFMKQQTFL